MASERLQRQIDRLLDEAEKALESFDWQGLQQRAAAVLALDPNNADASSFLAASEGALGGSVWTPPVPQSASPPATPLPTSIL